jgi:hypothetical protein
VILDEVARRSLGKTRFVVGGALVAAGIADIVVRSLGETSLSFFDELRTHVFLLVSLLGVAIVAIVAITALRSSTARLAALIVFCTAVSVVSLTPAGYIGIRQTGEFSPYGEAELDGYQAAYDMTRLIASKDRPSSRVLLWTNLSGLADIGWTNLPHQEGGIESAEAPTPLPLLTPTELDMLRYPTTSRVLVLSQSTAEVNSALPALQRQDLQPKVEASGAWSDGSLLYVLIELHAQ